MYRVGLIGCGFIAKKHVKTIAQLTELTLVAVSDIKREQMESIVSLYKDLRGGNPAVSSYKKYEHMLFDPEIDVVIIATTSNLHASMAKKAIQNDKHVIVEKPFSLSLKEANEVIQLSQSKNKKVFICHQLRYRPLLVKVKNLVDQGHFGQLYFGVVSLRLHRSIDYYDSSTWKGTWKKDGGMLLNQGIHLIDLLTWLMGDVHSVYGEIASIMQNKETEDIATGIISFKNHAKGLIEANIITKPKNLGYFLSVFGEKGSLCIGGKGLNEIDHCYIENNSVLKEELLKLQYDTNEHYYMYKDFIRSLNNHHRHLMNAREAKRALEVIFALYQAAQEGKPSFLPIENFSTTDMRSI